MTCTARKHAANASQMHHKEPVCIKSYRTHLCIGRQVQNDCPSAARASSEYGSEERRVLEAASQWQERH